MWVWIRACRASSEALTSHEGRDPRDGRARLERRRPRIHDRLQGARLLESAFRPRAIAAAQRLHEGHARVGERGEHRATVTGDRADGAARDEGGDEQGSDPADDAVDESQEGHARRDHEHDEGLDRRGDREARLRRQETRDGEGESERHRQLPPADAGSHDDHLGDEDAEDHPDDRFEHATRTRVAHQPEARHRDGGRQQRGVVTEDVAGEDVRRRRRPPRSGRWRASIPAGAPTRVPDRSRAATRWARRWCQGSDPARPRRPTGGATGAASAGRRRCDRHPAARWSPGRRGSRPLRARPRVERPSASCA